MSEFPNCPKCNCEYTYEDRGMYICPECFHEWSTGDADEDAGATVTYKDAHGNTLVDGDSVTVLKDIKVRGTSLVIKGGTKVKNIRLVDSDHNIDCKIAGIGPMKLKSELVKKS